MRPKTSSLAANIPAFLSKLWKIVNDPDTDHLISWSSDGHSFIIQNQAQFWYNLLPIYYKHNNMSSFIRQLNMYGFHKVSSESGGVESDRDELKFYHAFFQQEQPNLMKLIKRKMASAKTPGQDEKVANVDQISKVLVDVKQLRGRQESVDNQLAAMKQENAALWQELALLRQKHMKQQQIVNKLIHFLVHIVNPNRGGLGGLGVKRRYPLMINDARPTKSPKTEPSAGGDGPTIHELETEINEKSAQIEENLLNIPIIDSPETLNSEMLLNDEPNPSTSSTNFPLKDDLLQAANEYIDINNFENTDDVLEKNSSEALISNLVSETRIPTELEDAADETTKGNSPKTKENAAENVKLNSINGIFRGDLDNHLESTQGELESIKDMLFDGYSLDANALLGNQNQSNNRFDGIPFQMFNDVDFPLEVPSQENESSDPMMSGSIMSYNNPPFVLDFDNLFEEQQNDCSNDEHHLDYNDDVNDELTTPVVIKKEPPTFPSSVTKRNVK